MQRLHGIRGQVDVQRLRSHHELHTLFRALVREHYDATAVRVTETGVRYAIHFQIAQPIRSENLCPAFDVL